MRTFLRIFILLFVASTCGFSITTQASGAALSRSRLNFVLLQAAKSGDLAKVKRALAGGADVNVRDPQGTTPLMLAASGGYEAIVKLLLTQGADSHIKRKDNETALSLAISSGHTTIAQKIAISQSSDFAAVYSPGAPLLSWAAMSDDLAAVRACLRRGIKLDSLDVAAGLGYAAMLDFTDIVDYLLAHGADVNRPIEHGQTPLMLAAATQYPGSTKMVTRLLNAGAKIDATDADGKTALLWAASAANLPAIQVLVKHGADISHEDNAGDTAEALVEKSGAGTAQAIAVYLERASSHTLDTGLRQELVAAETKGDAAKLQSLLAQGGDVNARDDNGDTLLILAAKQGKTPILRLLIKNKADLEAKSLDYWHDTALLYACEEKQIETAEALLNAGADPNAKGSGGNTSLIGLSVAFVPGELALAEALIAHGAKVNETDDNGETALINAATYGNIDMARLLLDHGAKINARDVDGATGLFFAVENAWTPIVRLLIGREADVNLPDDVQGTPLKVAEDHLKQPNSGNVQIYRTIISMLREAGAHQ